MSVQFRNKRQTRFLESSFENKFVYRVIIPWRNLRVGIELWRYKISIQDAGRTSDNEDIYTICTLTSLNYTKLKLLRSRIFMERRIFPRQSIRFRDVRLHRTEIHGRVASWTEGQASTRIFVGQHRHRKHKLIESPATVICGLWGQRCSPQSKSNRQRANRQKRHAAADSLRDRRQLTKPPNKN